MGAPCKLVRSDSFKCQLVLQGQLIYEKSRNMKNTQGVLREGVGGIRLI